GRQRAANVFRTIVATDGFRLAAPADDPIQRPGHTRGRQREVNVDVQPFAVVIVDDVEQPDTPAIRQLIVHEIHRPDLIDGFRYRQRRRLLAHQALFRLDSQVQLQFAVDAPYPLVVPGEPLDVAQIQKAQPETPVAMRRRQPDQPVGNGGILVGQRRLVAVARLADTEGPAGQPDTHTPGLNHLLRHLAPARWRYNFFRNASWTISALSRSSAYIFFSRRFSSSSSFSRVISAASMP